MSEIILPSLDELQKRLAKKTSVFDLINKEQIERFFAPYLGRQWSEEFLVEVLSVFLWKLPSCALDEAGIQTKIVSTLSPKELKHVAKILVKNRKVRKRTLRAVRKAPEPETPKDTAIDEAN